MTAVRTPSEQVDVCVIGAGPAGAIVAHSLADRGYDVVVLEAGPRFSFEDRHQRMERAIRPAFSISDVWDMGGQRDQFSTGGDRSYPLNNARVKGVGGTSLHWQGMVMRFHVQDFEMNSRHGVGTDWPFDYETLKDYYQQAEQELGVAGAMDNPFAPPRDDPFPMPAFPPSYSDSVFAPACERLGVTMHSVPNARNSESYDGQSQCVGYGTCQPVCPSGAKYDATRHIMRAEQRGVRVIDEVPVQSLIHDDAGESVVAAEYKTPDGDRHRQAARVFVVACGGIETPRLLLLSESAQYPDGLANSSGLVGRYFMDHLFAGMGGVIDQPTRQNHIGFVTSECHQFYDDPSQGTNQGIPALDCDWSELGSIKLEFFNYAGPSPVELAMDSEEWGNRLLESLRDAYGRSIGMGALVGQLPRADNRVTLDRSTTDNHGNPVPEIHWTISDRTRRTIKRANEIQREILDALDTDITWTVGPETTGPAFHHMGTTRMGSDPATSVVSPELRTHDLANLWIAGSSVFVTGGAMNPTLTIGAVALKAVDHIAASLNHGLGQPKNSNSVGC